MTASEAIVWLQQGIASGKIKPDEPCFPLVAHDFLAAGAVTTWAGAARDIGVPESRCQAAMQTAQEMRDWPEHHVPGCGKNSHWHTTKRKGKL